MISFGHAQFWAHSRTNFESSQAKQAIEGNVKVVGYLGIGMLVGCLAGSISLYFGVGFLLAVGVFFPLFGSAGVLSSAVAARYALPALREKVHGQN
ncbi:hypothetical protein [Ruegeria atlantica]|uniref:Uncharacterized protein n=1 Tax=Ruegeria atlantica TaxID=81569 RepID=A0A0P1E244_9RHOB|nr:hypothetical protein [Ruegeria atlantica]CUH42209.1 hypothetical protein RUM4293_01095 [Ruegeria atlantica]